LPELTSGRALPCSAKVPVTPAASAPEPSRSVPVMTHMDGLLGDGATCQYTSGETDGGCLLQHETTSLNWELLQKHRPRISMIAASLTVRLQHERSMKNQRINLESVGLVCWPRKPSTHFEPVEKNSGAATIR
ncbi:MAG: hypothetical protein V4587_17690, partial [Acidobacteriota bacterium]